MKRVYNNENQTKEQVLETEGSYGPTPGQNFPDFFSYDRGRCGIIFRINQ
jgi:hypothetical protein